jgi:arylsulfatase A-like enzyme
LAAVAVLLATVASAAAAPAAKRPPNVLLIIVDDLRADRLGAYGHGGASTPNFDALARRGALFTEAFSQAGWTLPSVSSILTGLYPTTHGVRRSLPEEWEADPLRPAAALKSGSRLSPARVTLAAELRRRGYRTEAVVSCPFCDPVFGFGNGFDHYEHGGGTFEDINRAVSRRLNVLAAKQPFFLYVHVLDAHRDGQSAMDDPEQRRLALSNYDAAVKIVDDGLGRLMAGLRARKLLGGTIVVATSDHGEEFGEHDHHGHGDSPYDTALHVPLLIRAPGARPRRIAGPVQTIDILPTVLDLAGLPPLSGAQGASLKPLIDAPDGAASGRTSYSEIYPHVPTDNDRLAAVAVRTPLWKYIWRPDGRDELYRIAVDPGEAEDLAAERPLSTANFRRRVQGWLEDREREASRSAASPDAVLPAEEVERLRQMGYLPPADRSR